MKMQTAYTIVLASMLSACSSQVLLTIESEPPGAAVFEGGKYWGRAPVTLSYLGSSDFNDGGCMGTAPIKVEWENGAQARVSTISVCGSQEGDREFLFTYPEGFPGIVAQSQVDYGVKPPLKRVAPNGQLYWEVTHSPTESKLRCYSDLSGATVKTNCS